MEYPDWFAHYAVRFFEQHLASLAGAPGLRFLQIGAFIGDASEWLLDNILTDHRSRLIDVDTWKGSGEPEHEAFDWLHVRRTYLDRIHGRRQVGIYPGTSSEYFARYAHLDGPFDFIYVDGDHTPAGVLEDGVSAARHLKVGGLLAFDDYRWLDPRTGRGPGEAIDAIETVYRGILQPIQSGLQVWFRRVA